MAEFTQSPEGQALWASFLAEQAGSATTGGGLVDAIQGILDSFVVDAAIGSPLVAAVSSMEGTLYFYVNALVDSLRDVYLSGENCPPQVPYPPWGQRGPRWIIRSTLP